VRSRFATIVIAVCLSALCACGSSEEQERQRIAGEAALKKAIADSLAEEREKDRRMVEAASADASQRLARGEAERDQELAKASAADAAAAQIRAAEEQKRAADAEVLRRYTDKLKASVPDPDSLQLRYAEVSPKRNGMCAFFNARDKTGRVLGYKRVVVTDARVATEEPPTREGMAQYLLFQIAARDTGCFPDVQQVKMMQ
jgi:hypothetical protein